MATEEKGEIPLSERRGEKGVPGKTGGSLGIPQGGLHCFAVHSVLLRGGGVIARRPIRPGSNCQKRESSFPSGSHRRRWGRSPERNGAKKPKKQVDYLLLVKEKKRKGRKGRRRRSSTLREKERVSVPENLFSVPGVAPDEEGRERGFDIEKERRSRKGRQLLRGEPQVRRKPWK